MSGFPLRLRPVCGCLFVFLSTATASAQWLPTGNHCYCAQPMLQACYRTVPVTEYREMKQRVQRPVVETKYVEQPVTEYQPIVETKTASVPVVRYKTVTEHRVVQQNRGYWSTRFHPVSRVAPHQYDGRPDLFGWLNRTGYAIRTALTPAYRTSWEYVPQIVEHSVPVTRRIPIHENRQVTYRVTRYQPTTTMKKVAVNTVRYVAEERTVLRPVTVMRTVPIGSSVAYSYAPTTAGGTQTALQPVPDSIGSAGPSTKIRAQSADSGEKSEKPLQRKSQRKEIDTLLNFREISPAQKSSFRESSRNSSAEPNHPDGRRARAFNRAESSIARMNGWRPRSVATRGPRLVPPAVSVVKN